MVRLHRIHRLLGLSAVLLLAFSGVALAGPHDERGEAPGLERQEFVQSLAELEAYWTPERMREAEAMDLLVLDEPTHQSDAGDFAPAGKPESFAPQNPDGASYVLHLGSEVRDDLFTPSSYPFPYNRYEYTGSYTAYPYSTMGRLFFTTPWGASSCSGTVVSSFNRSLVWTAGHCLHGGPGSTWYSNVVFVPAYRDGAAPLGMWNLVAGTVFTEWSQNGNFRYDLAGAQFAPNPSGQRLQDVVGSQGIKFNWGLYWYTNFGYPADWPFTGQRLIVCVANWAVLDSPPGSGPQTIGKGCDMTGGASGGGWHTDFGANGGFVESVNSYKYFAQPEAIYGPYHGDAALDLYLFVRQ